MEELFSIFQQRSESNEPVRGIIPRISNIIRNNFRGIIGTIVPVLVLSLCGINRTEFKSTVTGMWIAMSSLMFLQPVDIPVSGLVPIFMLPLLGAMDSTKTCGCYMNESMLFFLLSSMILLMWNNSGLDRRVGLWFLNYRVKPEKYTPTQLLVRAGTASFVLSIFCDKLIVTSFLLEYVAKPLPISGVAASKTEPNHDKVRAVICNTIQTSSAIGSIILPHTSTAMVASRMIYYESAPAGSSYPDVFNYFQYVGFALPVALVMHLVNLLYNMLLLCKQPHLSVDVMKTLETAMLKYKEEIPKKITLHEILTLIAKIIILVVLFTRWSTFFGSYYTGWNRTKEPGKRDIPGTKDTTVHALFVILLHILPKGFGFTRHLNFKKYQKKSQLRAIKSESAILQWSYVNKHVNYGYMLLLGSGVAVTVSARDTLLGKDISKSVANTFGEMNWKIIMLLNCLTSVTLANVMPSVAACVMWLPFVLMASLPPNAPPEWTKRTYLSALAVGAGTTFGFCWPFMYTPAYYCYYIGKVPLFKMVKYGAGSAVLCMLILWLSLIFYAPYLWDSMGFGVMLIYERILRGTFGRPTTTATTSITLPPG